MPNSENLFIRLGETPGDPFTTNASFRTITCLPRGARHALFIRSKRTDNQWCIYSDNAEMVGWLQKTVQGMPNPETAGSGTAVMGAVFCNGVTNAAVGISRFARVPKKFLSPGAD